ncbi:Phosphatidate cytidylyltransferase [Rubripirellula lacrimiformis]|uniref:Phosphatidate cytidylyltransferase n=1 Tax=Rubripirellula lacrimiformis TaxID=1930273 RepID=A0A517N6M3_9BACT|nr:phosphatidate cytidylyltransferase [Rubripirellula lacrimiformis]QDT02782.1 Phosphatidate cytidylyltransferase [Rubripirellula lacrimiformis]
MNHLAPEVRTTILCLFAALAVSSVLTLLIQRVKPDRDYRELRSRVRTWWTIVGLFSVTLVWSPTATVAFLGFVSFLGLKEFLSMTPTRRADRRVLFYAYLAVPIQYYFAASAWYGMFIVFIPVLMFVWLPTRMWMIGQTDGFLRAAGSLHWALMITVFSLSHAAYLLAIQPAEGARFPAAYPSEISMTSAGPGLLMFLILVTELNDIFQYMWGKSLGRTLLTRKVAPLVSPGKTWAGLIGGVATTVALAAWLGPRLTIMDLPRSVLAGIIIGLAGFAGDLCLSALKRDLKIKDFGATLPGHGGILDRVDSLIFTAPLFLHFVYYCYG